jgi:hypothetical protein|tara:strand:- start:5932 stop:6348 length:417 start_codon:yes stop_codon:yes gene_type:complete
MYNKDVNAEIIERYSKEIEVELHIDEFNIKEMSLKTPARKHYWVCRLIQHKKSLLNLKAERYSLREDIVQAIQRESPVKVTRPIAEKSSYQHEGMIELQHRIDEQELIVDYLEKVERTFTSLGFDIKNIIEIMKMETI